VTASSRQLCASLAVAAALATALSSSGGSTTTARPCWKLVINEWYSGQITSIFPRTCYTEAIKHIPHDLRNSASLIGDIRAAEIAAENGKPAPPERPLPASPRIPPLKPTTSFRTIATTTRSYVVPLYGYVQLRGTHIVCGVALVRVISLTCGPASGDGSIKRRGLDATISTDGRLRVVRAGPPRSKTMFDRVAAPLIRNGGTLVVKPGDSFTPAGAPSLRCEAIASADVAIVCKQVDAAGNSKVGSYAFRVSDQRLMIFQLHTASGSYVLHSWPENG
jgi:hypothetical protein